MRRWPEYSSRRIIDPALAAAADRARKIITPAGKRYAAAVQYIREGDIARTLSRAGKLTASEFRQLQDARHRYDKATKEATS